ncbi:hypothetical protein BH10ACT1_BH10ACT1_28780 [soil metagenome]
MLEDPPFDLLSPGRRPTGVGPVLLPYTATGDVDWDGFAHLLGRVAETSLIPAINLAPGAGDLLDPSTRAEVLATTGAALGSSTFVAGVRAEPGPDGGFDPARLSGAVAAVGRHDAMPLLLPSPALASLGPDEFVGLLAWMGDWCDRFLVVEAPPERWPGGHTWGLDVFGALLELGACVGVVHASWSRAPEWDRLRLRDDRRSGFQIFSANEHAVDQIMFGSDHALDLAAAVPDALADRDDAWEVQDLDVLERHDALQALASLVFRPPVAASRHALARVLQLRGWLPHDRVHPDLPRRPASDDELLVSALDRLGLLDLG